MHDGSLELVDCYMKLSCLHGGLAALPLKYRQGGQDLLSNQPSQRTTEDIKVWILASLVLFSQLVVEGRSEGKSMAKAGEMPEDVVPLLSFGCHRAILKEVLQPSPWTYSIGSESCAVNGRGSAGRDNGQLSGMSPLSQNLK